MTHRLICTYCIFFCALFTINPCIAQEDAQEVLEEERTKIRAEIQQLLRLRENNKKEEQSILSEVEDLDAQIRLRSEFIAITNRQTNLLTREIEDNLNKIQDLREELAILKEDYAAMIRKSYKNKDGQNKVMFLLSSESFRQAYKRVQYMKQYANYRKKQGEQLKERTLLLQELNKKLLDQKKDKENLIAENKKAKIELDKERVTQDALIATIRKKEGTYAAQIRKKQKEADRIDKEIDRLIREAIAANNKKNGTKTTKGSARTFALTPEETILAADFESNKGRLIWPVERGRVTKRFGVSRHPTLPNITVKNSGVEIETNTDAQARAAFKGEVFSIITIPGANKVVMIRHGNYITVYQNLKTLNVKTGDKVATKQVLGTIAKNGFSGRTILKFSVRKNDTPLNPASWVFNM